MHQAAQARVPNGWGFFCFSVLPWYFAIRALRVLISSGLNRREALCRRPASPRPLTSCITMQAATMAAAARRFSASPSAIKLSSRAIPCDFRERNSCSIVSATDTNRRCDERPRARRPYGSSTGATGSATCPEADSPHGPRPRSSSVGEDRGDRRRRAAAAT